MQLLNIKIAGFKSFVDPTTISLPSKLLAIVGPNGCGKSNIIDAVTWVMGESSPKYLRGESSTDVIFNGSSARKPVGQASVELVFDNADGTIGGEYRQFAEISIKRVINRESDSTYYLNGVKCRKRDVVDLFLGTGLGPRSYSIIGQNMISRIIEAKPDDLRSYLEEAAGISKYKERRHETELRINHTKENLARVLDIRLELEKQLGHLKHQANVAEKFKLLKEQERLLKAELYAIEWRELDRDMVDYTLQIKREETNLEARLAEITSTNQELLQLQADQRESREAFEDVQKRYYAAGNEITRVEQDILHHKERQQQCQTDLEQIETDCQQIKQEIAQLTTKLTEAEQFLETELPTLDGAQEQLSVLIEQQHEYENLLHEWQQRWDIFNQQASTSMQTLQVEKTRIQHFEERIAQLVARAAQIDREHNTIDYTALEVEIEQLQIQLGETELQRNDVQQALAAVREQLNSQQQHIKLQQSKLNDLLHQSQQLAGKEVSLQALQQAALGQQDNNQAEWLETHGLTTATRLAQHLHVESGWESAVEKALGQYLQAICVSAWDEWLDHLDKLQSSHVAFFKPELTKPSASTPDKLRLIDKIKSDLPLEALLGHIYIADSVPEAQKIAATLAAHESVITKDGVWLNDQWLLLRSREDVASGVLEREQQLKTVREMAQQIAATIEDHEHELQELQQASEKFTLQRETLQQQEQDYHAQLTQQQAQLKIKIERSQQLQQQATRLAQESIECVEQHQKILLELDAAQQRYDAALLANDSFAEQRELLISERDETKHSLQIGKERLTYQQNLVHQIEMRLEATRSQQYSHQQQLERHQQQLQVLTERRGKAQHSLIALSPMHDLEEQLSRALDKHVSIETELNAARTNMEILEQELQNLTDKRQIIEREVEKIRNRLEKLRVEWQGWKIKSENLLQQIKETESTLEEILQQLPDEVDFTEWQERLTQTTQRIQRLGSINLLAIDEYATCLERKEYLDRQVEDLQTGLATLEDAIHKIDKETKQRFKETFDKVNSRFQELFPTIFGGGKAYLELTSDDLLAAGVSLMACPPGKRNSTIHLLSGGEKSLTAIALIFSIFHLNPAPFCLLDEVDAALDDANVLRFTRLVKVMAEKTQFLFISHNKITIEMGQHLIGVTMHEPGVSRLVSVDIEKAISLAEA